MKKQLIIHADDAGLAWSENQATQKGMLEGSISSCSLMVPCPWFYNMAQFCLQNPELDYGIHLTLTGEWKSYPFRSVLPPAQVSSLLDEKGHFYPKRNQFLEKVNAAEAYLELKAQIDRALSFGLTPSHLDSHMFTLGMRQDLVDVYRQLGKEYQLPILLSKKLINLTGASADTIDLGDATVYEQIFMGDFELFNGQGLASYYDRVLDNLPEGLSLLLIHPADRSAEMDEITIDHPNFGAVWRAEDATYFSSAHCREKIKANGIELVHWGSPDVLSQHRA